MLKFNRTMLKIIYFIILFGLLNTELTAQELYLECEGTSNVKVRNTTTFDYDYSTSFTTTSEEKMYELVRIDINDKESRIKIPNSFIQGLSKLNKNAKDGWYPLKNVEISEEEIKGNFSLDIIFSPKVLISRYTGDIAIKGNNKSFMGSCRKLDKPKEKLF